VAGVATFERLTLSSPPIDGIVLRYGHLYGPGTGAEAAQPPAVHVDAAASAAALAVDKAHPGIYNIADPNGYLSVETARRILGFDAQFRRPAVS
jgi:nucleoside-diphosphate-sugar epimerase